MAECGEQIRVGGKLSDGPYFRDVRGGNHDGHEHVATVFLPLANVCLYMVASATSPTTSYWP